MDEETSFLEPEEVDPPKACTQQWRVLNKWKKKKLRASCVVVSCYKEDGCKQVESPDVVACESLQHDDIILARHQDDAHLPQYDETNSASSTPTSKRGHRQSPHRPKRLLSPDAPEYVPQFLVTPIHQQPPPISPPQILSPPHQDICFVPVFWYPY